jgi:RNA polymerase primary sigma factor
MASKTKATPQKKELPEKEGADTLPDCPLLDLSDAAVKKLIRNAKKRGYVTVDQINSVLPSEEVNSEQIEDVLAMFSEMGVNVVETEEAEPDEEAAREEQEEETESESSSELAEVQRAVPAKSETKEPAERTDDPVRMYLREMGSVELLSREGEIAIAKRIEAGREAMIAGLCESPLTFQAIIIWRDELNEGKVFLRDIIDLEATYAGPDAKAIPAPVGPDGQPIVPGVPVAAEPPQTVAPATAPAGATPFETADAAHEIDAADAPDAGDAGDPNDPADSSDSSDPSDPSDSADPSGAEAAADPEEPPKQESAPESEFDDDMENSLSLAAIEAELKPKVLETFDTIANEYKRLRRLQDQDIQFKLKSTTLSPAQERKYKKLALDYRRLGSLPTPYPGWPLTTR